MFAKGLAKPSLPPSWPFLGVLLAANGFSFGKDRPPSPARWRAILVPILFKKDIVEVHKMFVQCSFRCV